MQHKVDNIANFVCYGKTRLREWVHTDRGVWIPKRNIMQIRWDYFPNVTDVLFLKNLNVLLLFIIIESEKLVKLHYFFQ